MIQKYWFHQSQILHDILLVCKRISFVSIASRAYVLPT